MTELWHEARRRDRRSPGQSGTTSRLERGPLPIDPYSRNEPIVLALALLVGVGGGAIWVALGTPSLVFAVTAGLLGATAIAVLSRRPRRLDRFARWTATVFVLTGAVNATGGIAGLVFALNHPQHLLHSLVAGLIAIAVFGGGRLARLRFAAWGG